MKRKKIKPNEKCICGSGKKYKKCCRQKVEEQAIENRVDINTLYENGHEITNHVLYDWLTQEYPDFKVIDVSNLILGKGSYKKILTKHYYKNTILIATRNEENNNIFNAKGDDTTDCMVMFKGAHQVFSQFTWTTMRPQIKIMIKRRQNNESYSY